MSEETKKRLALVRMALRFWDPIGVIEDRIGGTGIADNEYDSYASGVLRALQNGRDARGLADHLAGIRHTSISLGDKSPTEREAFIAEQLVAWREQKFHDHPNFAFRRYSD
jgi:hypothetical protein